MTPTVITHSPSQPRSGNPNYLIFFITGNPGLIGYYDAFLSTLHQLLESSHSDKFDAASCPNYYIYGQSLAGFEDVVTKPPTADGQPYSLNDQIRMKYQSLLEAASAPPSGSAAKKYDGVILIGHSVGSYILMELLRLHKEASAHLPSHIKARAGDHEQTQKEQEYTSSPLPVPVNAGILLFPTVTHIAQSPSGVKFTFMTRWIPGFVRRASAVARAFVCALPTGVVETLIKGIARFPPSATQVTRRFLTSGFGIWQALHMAHDEMQTITEDRWDEDIWGVEHEDANGGCRTRIPKLIFYFGQKDHWVSDHTRDALIAARAGNRDDKAHLASKPVMLIDERGLPHSFCIKHSEIVAEKAKGWIEEVIAGEM